jgi:glycosyltransferase involved in cell wall biosynthesis
VTVDYRPRIAFLLSSLKFGGAERVALNLAHALKARGFAIDFLLMSAEGELIGEARQHFDVVNLACARIWQLPLRLARYLTATRPNALISSFWKLNLCACLARLAAPKTKLALWEHSPPSRSRNSPTWLYFPTASLLYRLATRVIAVSDGVAADVRRVSTGLVNRIVTIYNAIPPPDVLPSRGVPGRRIIWVGRFSEPKNPGLLLHAFGMLPCGSVTHLEMLGDGELRPELETQARVRGLADRISFPGFRSDVYARMAKADLLVLSSDREGLGNVLVEALYAGLGIVSTDCGEGVREVLQDGHYGSIVPVGDPAAMASAIEHEFANRRDGGEQRAAAARFNPRVVAEQFVAALGIDECEGARTN